MHRRSFVAGGLQLLLACFLALRCEAGLKIYFLRHAEGGHNVVKAWADKPKDRWPVYVGNENMFTPLGETQAAAVPAKLVPYRFDLIACSPLWRTRHTILPYLRDGDAVAEIWPELEEFSYQHEVEPLPPPGPRLFDGGPKIEIPADEARWFSLRDGATARIRVAKEKRQATADIEALMVRLEELIRVRFGGADRSILLVGHGSSGSVLLKRLVRDTSLPWPRNAALWMIEEQRDGSFRLMIANDEPAR